MMKTHYAKFARYNRWANRRIYETAAALSDAEFHADRGAFFHSLCGTLNHVLVGDRAWLKRITGEGPEFRPLDTILFENLSELAAAREAEDARIISVVDGLDESRFGVPLTYRNYEGREFTQPLGEVFAHLFNHQTHHRGQAHAILRGLGRAGPVIDLAVFLREPEEA